ncbi:MAG: PorT family protein [Candidatus Eisenbacteria bacterium]|jgi:hypothetical protein|nr:PorT family protein [Candidatus Eisenbacteria bacterium]
MNRKAVLALTAFALTAALAAAPAQAGVTLGLKAGITTSQLGSSLGDLKWRAGVGGGGSLAVDLTPNIAFAPELLWLRKGSTFTSTDVSFGGFDFGNIRTGIDLDYVEVPLLLRLQTGAPGSARLMLVGGPTVAFKVSERLTTDGILDTHLNTDEMETLDYGVAVGAGLRLPAGGLNWTFEARYEQGLADVSKLPFGPDLKNGSVQALVGLEFPLIGR